MNIPLIRRSLHAIAAAIALALIAACSPPDSQNDGLQQVSLRLNWTPSAEHAVFYLGIEKGFFATEGLDLEIRPGTGSVDAVKLVGSGNDTFGTAVADAVAIGRGRGIPVVSLAVLLQQSPNVIGSLEQSGISRPEDLYGKTVAINVKSTTYAFWLAFLEAASLDDSRIRTMDMGALTQVGPLVAGKVDASILLATNELVALRARDVDVSTIDLAAYGVHSYGQVLFTTDDYAKSHPDVVRGMLRASLRSLQYALDNVPEAVAAMKREVPDVDSEIELAKWKEIVPRTRAVSGEPVPLGHQTIAGWTRTVETFRAAGLIESSFEPAELIVELP